MDVTVAVATYGDPYWKDLARRAVASVPEGVPFVHVHGPDLHSARNMALEQVETEWVCHLDADDELEPGFFEAIDQVDGDLRPPAVRYAYDGHARGAAMPRVAGHRHLCEPDCLNMGNWLVVGTVARAELLRDVGGWRDWPCYEDWDLWLRCWLAGASITPAYEAIYRAHVHFDSRNRGTPRDVKEATHQAIVEANLPKAVA